MTSLSDHCNSVSSSPSVIHSEPLLNIGCSESQQQAFETKNLAGLWR